MNKYDFDFRKIEDVLYDVLGIVNPTNIASLKAQIKECLKSLSDAIEKKKIPEQEARRNIQRAALDKELGLIEEENDLDKVLQKCITIKYLTLLSLDFKVREEDSYEEKSRKLEKRNEIFALSALIESVPSVVDLTNNRNLLLDFIDTENRVIPFNHEVTDTSKPLDEQTTSYPFAKLGIVIYDEPKPFNSKIDMCLRRDKIYAYNYGEVIYSKLIKNEGELYTLEKMKKKLVGIVKQDEFGEDQNYSVLINYKTTGIPAEFFRDILFSDMLLRNSKNNLGFVGVPKFYSSDSLYRYKVKFDEANLSDMLRAIYFEDNPEMVVVESNFQNVLSVKSALEYISENYMNLKSKLS